MKITMYGAPICRDCVAAKEALTKMSGIDVEYRNITESTVILKEFLKYRDTEQLFEAVKDAGKIGIPFYIMEDGTKTLNIEQYVDVVIDKDYTGTACSLDGKGNC